MLGQLIELAIVRQLAEFGGLTDKLEDMSQDLYREPFKLRDRIEGRSHFDEWGRKEDGRIVFLAGCGGGGVDVDVGVGVRVGVGVGVGDYGGANKQQT